MSGNRIEGIKMSLFGLHMIAKLEVLHYWSINLCRCSLQARLQG